MIETTKQIPEPSELVFNVDYGKWIIKMREEGIFFNHELYPEARPSDFAKTFMEILEKQYAIKFIEKATPNE